MTTPTPFDLAAPIPDGTTVIEASAGTGKTFAIVGLAARCIAEGTPVAKLLLVTFSRSATAALRERMRERVHDLVVALADPESAAVSPDVLTRYLAGGTPAEITERRRNLSRALSDFDASTIATTHTFCNRMLEALGFLGERDVVQQIVEDADDLVEQSARDLYLAGYRTTEAPQIDFSSAIRIAKDAVQHQGLRLAPTEADLSAPGPADGISAARHRVAFARRLREIVVERTRSAHIRTYDDLQMILYRVVADDHVGKQACDRIRDRFDLVLIDEFQDTDPFQWEIVRRCFHGHRTLVLVGDPKQSIYGFRGAEILSYLQAVRTADSQRVLVENWRSEGNLVEGLAALYEGAALGNPDIVVRPVTAARPGSSLHPASVAPVRIRAFTRKSFPVTGASGFPSVGDIRSAISDDVASDIAGLLDSGVTLEVHGERRAPQPGDIAILVKTNKTIAPLQEALARVGVASVIGTGMSVFHTAAAHTWLAVIKAVEQPARSDRVRLAALTPLIGWSPERLDTEGDRGLAALASGFHEFGRVFNEGGFAAMSQRLMAVNDVGGRVLAQENGERTLTDLIQIASLSNKAVVDAGLGLGGVGEWLADRMADTSSRRRTEDQTRRLDRDTQVVQIMTVHASKGLQFPIVYVPFGWDVAGGGSDEPDTFTFHDANGERFLDVGGPGAPGVTQRRAHAHEEIAGDDLRLLYVALTRAHSQVITWWAPAYRTRSSSLHRVLFGRIPGTASIPDAVDVPDDRTCLDRLEAVAARSPFIALEKAGAVDGRRWTGAPGPAASTDLSAARFDRIIDRAWRRTSYSAIVADAAHPVLGTEPSAPHHLTDSGSEPQGDVLDDEPADSVDIELPPIVDDNEPPTGTPSLMNGLPFGAAFGTLVHEVLEHVDTDSPDITEHVAALCGDAGRFRQLDVDTEVLTRALIGVLTTPLSIGTLWAIPTRNRLAELEFEFPLAGGADSTEVTSSSIADLVERHLGDHDPFRVYPAHLRDLPEKTLRGFLTGSIDSVLRTDDDRYVVVDYKTNRLRAGNLVAEDFTEAAMVQEMIGSHYPLQALIYSVALHRYLRWRVQDYRPGRHLGPVQYHFVRGMIGRHTPPGCGVLEWAIPTELIEDLSDLLAGAATAGVR